MIGGWGEDDVAGRMVWTGWMDEWMEHGHGARLGSRLRRYCVVLKRISRGKCGNRCVLYR